MILIPSFIAIWLGLIAYFFFFELPAATNKRPGDTFSEFIRVIFHIKTKWGKVVWFVFFGLFAVWFALHIPYGDSWWIG